MAIKALGGRAVVPAPGLLRQTGNKLRWPLATSCDGPNDPRLSWSDWGGFGRPSFLPRSVPDMRAPCADRPRSDALEDVRASHPYHATIRADIRRDPSRSNCRRANEASRPNRRYSAI